MEEILNILNQYELHNTTSNLTNSLVKTNLTNELQIIKDCKNKLNEIEHNIIQNINKNNIIEEIEKQLSQEELQDFQEFINSKNNNLFINTTGNTKEINLQMIDFDIQIKFKNQNNKYFKLIIDSMNESNGSIMFYIHTVENIFMHQESITHKGCKICYHEYLKQIGDVEKKIQNKYKFKNINCERIFELIFGKFYIKTIENINFECICGAWNFNPNT